MQHMLWTCTGTTCDACAAAEGGCNVLSEVMASISKPSVALRAWRTGLKVRLPSGVVGAVDSSKRALSSESTEDTGVLFMLVGMRS